MSCHVFRALSGIFTHGPVQQPSKETFISILILHRRKPEMQRGEVGCTGSLRKSVEQGGVGQGAQN